METSLKFINPWERENNPILEWRYGFTNSLFFNVVFNIRHRWWFFMCGCLCALYSSGEFRDVRMKFEVCEMMKSSRWNWNWGHYGNSTWCALCGDALCVGCKTTHQLTLIHQTAINIFGVSSNWITAAKNDFCLCFPSIIGLLKKSPSISCRCEKEKKRSSASLPPPISIWRLDLIGCSGGFEVDEMGRRKRFIKLNVVIGYQNVFGVCQGIASHNRSLQTFLCQQQIFVIIP